MKRTYYVSPDVLQQDILPSSLFCGSGSGYKEEFIFGNDNSAGAGIGADDITYGGSF